MKSAIHVNIQCKAYILCIPEQQIIILDNKPLEIL